MNAERSHDADACGQCTFVADRDFIVVTSAQRQQAEVTLAKKLRSLAGFYDLEETIIPLGRFTLPRWNGHATFWLFTCGDCQQQSVDYLHGYRLYLKCQHCGANLRVIGERFYEEAGLPKPSTERRRR
ncbi:MAG TPA: hypothetical protein VMU12_02795 [Candidatus Paceibacterota bacterium]|nr:hypothetical protein [Candidatus Paceibacterota bacterium]